MTKLSIIPFLILFLSCWRLEASTWTSADGSKSFEGEYFSFSPSTGIVEIIIKGKLVKFHQSKLCVADRELLVRKIHPEEKSTKPTSKTSKEEKTPPASTSLPLREISPLVSQIRQESGLKGLSLGVIKDGALVAVGSDGRGGKDQEKRVQLDDTYIIASCTKPMTATLAAILVSEGIIGWDTTLGDLFEDKMKRIDRRYKEVTLTQLLSHTGGAPEMENFWQSGELSSAVRMEGGDWEKRYYMLEQVIERSPSVKVGKFEYSNAGFCFAASMLEEASGSSWDQLMEMKLFRPLGMKNSKPTSPQDSNPSVMAPAAGVSCTIEDFGLFAAFHIRRFMGQETVINNIPTNEIAHLFGDGRSRQSQGWFTFTAQWAGGRVHHHRGTNFDFNTEIWLVPEKKIAVVAATSGGIDKSSARRLERAIESVVERFRDSE